MSTQPLMTPEEIATAVDLRREKRWSFRKIGARLYYSDQTIRRTLLRVAPDLRYLHHPNKGEQADHLHAQGVSWRKVSAALGFKCGGSALKAAQRFRRKQQERDES